MAASFPQECVCDDHLHRCTAALDPRGQTWFIQELGNAGEWLLKPLPLATKCSPTIVDAMVDEMVDDMVDIMVVL